MINGVLNIYKEPGFTSHDVVAKLRGIVKQKKIGHTGTLDPDAEGVLPVCLGKATKLCDMLADETKTYEAVLLLGTVTDTQDTSGKVLAEQPVLCTEEEVSRCLESFVGDKLQIPPMYSALKQNGKKLYELAREGKEVERRPRPVHFYEITALKMELPRVWLKVTCSKGTYIRTLCHDIGEQLGCGGCMEHLTRTRVGSFEIKNARRLGEVQLMADQGRLGEWISRLDEVFGGFAAFHTCREADKTARNGGRLTVGQVQEGVPEGPEEMKCRLYDSTGAFIGIYRYNTAEASFLLWKMFYDAEENTAALPGK